MKKHLLKIFLQDIKLRDKLLLSFFICIFLPLLIFNGFSFRVINEILEKRIMFSATQAFDQTTDYMFYKTSKIIGVSDSIVVNDSVREILEKDVYTYSLVDQYEDLNSLRMYLNSLKDDHDVYNICLFIRDEVVHSSSDNDVGSISDAMKSKWYGQLPGSSSRILMCPPSYYEKRRPGDPDILSLARKITSSDDYIKIIGYLRIDFLEQTINQILHNANSIDGSFTYIRNSDDRIISTTDQELLKKYHLSLAHLEALQNVKEWTLKIIADEDVYVRTTVIPNTDWTIITIIPRDAIFADIKRLNHLMLIFMMILGTIVYGMSFFIAISLSKRLKRLSGKMNNISNENLVHYTMDMDSKDEIGYLARSYNFMIDRIISLIEQQYESGKELKNAELRVLQAQINPHFLYNTLDMINWMSYENKGKEIRYIVRLLSAFYKLSLSKGKSIITLKEELEHVSLYMQIQNVRFKDSIRFETICDKELMKYSIPKITLQPIVENAILHGIMAKAEKKGQIKITCSKKDKDIYISVEDDGIGMNESVIEKIMFQDDQPFSENGFGLKNIHNRLMLYYGADYGLTITSKEGIGTVIQVKISTEHMN